MCLWKVNSKTKVTCQESFVTATELDAHVCQEHVNSEDGLSCLWANCLRANKPYLDEIKLKCHVSEHTGGKQFICYIPQCSIKFGTRNALNNHVKSTHAEFTAAEVKSTSELADSELNEGKIFISFLL